METVQTRTLEAVGVISLLVYWLSGGKGCSFAVMDVFMLPVEVDGQEMELETRLVRQGYVYQFIVTINDKEFSFEKDEEGQLRAILDTETYTTLTKKEQVILEEVVRNLGRVIG